MKHRFGFSTLEDSETREESSVVVDGDAVSSADDPFDSIMKYGEAVIILGAAFL